MKGKTLLVRHKIKTGLISDIRKLIESARVRVARAVNTELTMLYWRIGKRIREDVPPRETRRIRTGDCRIADTTIDLDAFYSLDSSQRPLAAGFLRRDVPH